MVAESDFGVVTVTATLAAACCTMLYPCIFVAFVPSVRIDIMSPSIRPCSSQSKIDLVEGKWKVAVCGPMEPFEVILEIT